MSERLWYYAQDGTRYGPVPLTEVRALTASGGLRAEDLVWSDGMEDWAPAGSVPGLVAIVPHATLERFAESQGWLVENQELRGKPLLSANNGGFGAVEHRGHLIVARTTGSGKVAPFLETLVDGRAGSVGEAGWFKSMGSLAQGRWHLLALTDPARVDLPASELFGDPWTSRTSELAGLGVRLEISDSAIRLRYQEVSRDGVEHGLSGLVGSREDRFAPRVAGEALGALRLSMDLSQFAGSSGSRTQNDDIVWADGYFVQWPENAGRQ